jgi:hypothetical protein
MNAVEIEEAISALAEQAFDPVEFPFAFLQAFGNKDTTIRRLRAGASNKSDLGGVLQTNNIHIAVCPSGEVPKTLAALKESPATAKAKARFILATDGADFEYGGPNISDRLHSDQAFGRALWIAGSLDPFVKCSAFLRTVPPHLHHYSCDVRRVLLTDIDRRPSSIDDRRAPTSGRPATHSGLRRPVLAHSWPSAGNRRRWRSPC